MSSGLKIAVLCNNKMAIPAIQTMAQQHMLCSIATADTDSEVIHMIRQVAVECRVPYTTISKKTFGLQLQQWLDECGAGIVFVMTFPWRIPEQVLRIPELGFLNFHYGLLPEMRGADPIFESIRQRRQYAGVTVHVMNSDFDAGAIVIKEQIPINAEYTYGMLCSQLSQLGNDMCIQLLNDIKENNQIISTPQDEKNATYWPKISEEDLQVKWDSMDSGEIISLVRACNPIAKGVPAAINGWKIGLCDVSLVNLEGDISAVVPGKILAIDPQYGLLVFCKDGKAIKLEVIYTMEGVFPGYKLAFFGITTEMMFQQSLPRMQIVERVNELLTENN